MAQIAHPRVIGALVVIAILFGIYGHTFIHKDGYFEVEITFSDPDPHNLTGLKGTVQITLRNNGNMTVELKDIIVQINDSSLEHRTPPKEGIILYFEEIDYIKIPSKEEYDLERAWSIDYIPDWIKGTISYDYYENGMFVERKSFDKELDVPF